MVQILLISALIQLTLVHGQMNSTTSLSDNHISKQIVQNNFQQPAFNSNNNNLAFRDISNIIIILLLSLIIILSIVLIYYVKSNANRTHKQILQTIMQMQQTKYQNLSPTVNTINTVQSQALTISKDEKIGKHQKDFSITVNRIHRAFTTPVPSPININAKPVNNNTEVHGPFDIKKRQRINTFSNASELSPAIIPSAPNLILKRVTSDPQIYEMEGKELETSLANDMKHATDSDESMYENPENVSDIDVDAINNKEQPTPIGDLTPYMIDVTEVSVSEKHKNENDNMPPPMEFNCEEKSFEPLDMPNLPKDRLSQLSLNTQLEKYQIKKQRETLGDININLDIVHMDNVVNGCSDEIDLTDNGNHNGVNLIRTEDRFD